MKLISLGIVAFVLAALGTPIAFALFGAGAWYFLQDGVLPFSVYLQRTTAGLNSFPLLAIPLFILAGNLMNATGITDRIFGLALAIFGRVRGSLAYVNIASSMVFAGMSGVAQADAAGLGAVEIRAMRQQGYATEFSAAITAASSIIGPLIPPSVIMIVYAIAAQVSVGALFLAGIVPGLVMGLGMMAVVAFLAWRNPSAFPVSGGVTLAESWTAFLRAAPALLAPAILIAGLLGGFATPTELGAIAVAYAAVYGFVAGELDRSRLWEALRTTVLTCGVVLLIVAAAFPIGWIVAINNLPAMLSDSILSITTERWQVLLIINVGLLVVGCFVETTAILLIGLPALLPLAMTIGVDPLHFGLIVIFNLLIGGLTPPFGALLYVMVHIARVRFGALVVALGPFYIFLMAMLMLITYWPDPWLWLPNNF